MLMAVLVSTTSCKTSRCPFCDAICNGVQPCCSTELVSITGRIAMGHLDLTRLVARPMVLMRTSKKKTSRASYILDQQHIKVAQLLVRLSAASVHAIVLSRLGTKRETSLGLRVMRKSRLLICYSTTMRICEPPTAVAGLCRTGGLSKWTINTQSGEYSV